MEIRWIIISLKLEQLKMNQNPMIVFFRDEFKQQQKMVKICCLPHN